MKLEQLAPESRFRSVGLDRTGVVIRQGPSGTLVRWDNAGRKVRIEKKAKWGSKQKDKVYEFVAPAKPEVISNAVEVELLEGSLLDLETVKEGRSW